MMSKWDLMFYLFVFVLASGWLTILAMVFVGWFVGEAGESASKVIEAYFEHRETFIGNLAKPQTELPKEIGYKN